jgi:hypothetical protein
MNSNWYSAKNTFYYPRRDYRNNLGVVAAHLTENENKKINDALTANRKIKLGGNTSYGSVYQISEKYVMKKMKFDHAANDSDNLKIFLNEVRVGGLPGIEKVGPRIYAWRIRRDKNGYATHGEYIMDSFTKSGEVYTSLKKYAKKVCPEKNHPIFKMLKKTLTDFWKVTKGYHGDLHTENIAVILDPKNLLEPKRVIIFDYGSHKAFKVPVNDHTCFDDFVRIIDKQWKNTVNKYGANIEQYPENSNVNVVYPKRSQPRRPNTQLLRHITVTGKVYKKKELRTEPTLMKLLEPKTQRKITNYLLTV